MIFMWSIKFLSGPHLGQSVSLKEGLHVIGRDPSCQIPLLAKGISKQHAHIVVTKTKIYIEDKASKNGCFFKGKKIQKQQLQDGDRVALYNVIIELKNQQALQELAANNQFYDPYSQNQFSDNSFQQTESSQSSTQKPRSFLQNIKQVIVAYIDNVILPSIYKLAEWLEFRWLLACFVMAFIIFVTVFSSIPLLSILKSSLNQESRNNAESIALTLSLINRKSLQKNVLTAVTVDYALRRPQVQKAYIISAYDGRILAPSNMAHSYPKTAAIHLARKKNTKTIINLNSSTVLAVIPIRFYNPKTGENSPKAYSVVFYNKGSSLFLSSSKVASLLIQNLLIACLLGFVLFFFLIKLIEFPIQSINKQLSKALKTQTYPSINVKYQSSILSELSSHINSALNQMSLQKMLTNQKEDTVKDINRQNEMNNLVEIVGYPAISINIEENSIASVNQAFTDQLGFADILHLPISDISDGHLKEHLIKLIDLGKLQPQEIAFSEVELNQMRLQSTLQFVIGKQDASYAIITFTSLEEAT